MEGLGGGRFLFESACSLLIRLIVAGFGSGFSIGFPLVFHTQSFVVLDSDSVIVDDVSTCVYCSFLNVCEVFEVLDT